VQLDKSGSGYQFYMVILPGFDSNPMYLAAIKQLRAELAQKVLDNKPLAIHLCNMQWRATKVVSGD
jgi:hypothetical protein